MARKKATPAHTIYPGKTKIIGFFLFEAVVYIACCLLLGSLWLPLTMQLYHARNMLVLSTNHYITGAYGLDRMCYDIQRTSIATDAWEKRDQGSIIVRNRQGDYGWHIVQSRLMRISGVYTQGAWHTPVLSMVTGSCSSLTYAYLIERSSVVGVSYKLEMRGTQALSGFVAPRIGWML
jgi:hypothetical protein